MLELIISDFKTAVLFAIVIIVTIFETSNCISTCVLYITEAKARSNAYVSKATAQLNNAKARNEAKKNAIDFFNQNNK